MLCVLGGTPAATQSAPPTAVRVTPDNFARAETDMYFTNVVGRAGLGRLDHYRELMPIARQTVVRPNRDTLYSSGVFDLDAGSVTITLPDAGKRFLSLQIIDEDHYVPIVVYGGGTHRFTREQVGTRYMLAGIRILIDPTDAKDAEKVHALQDAIKVSQPGGPGAFEAPQWDKASQKQVRDALGALRATVPDFKRAFGPRGQVDPVRHLIGAATAWGGNPDKDATYLNVTPAKNDGATVHRLTVGAVPVDGFWSISVYNAQGYFDASQSSFTLNSLTAKKSPDGTVTVQFGGCNKAPANCLSIVPGWNYMVRLYRPRPEILDSQWVFPEAQPAP
ncbi:DUF1254 domain-containing protein [Sphingomonas cavernae]|uniref:DUF1254 domain-containing protein n=2 Tax=Sphingomonas cavernae TaxID=2320861 RepID=A0A418WSU6_9SPHN|nr:DUF1254 domain-containing protein [Sphingomonas cavernae]